MKPMRLSFLLCLFALLISPTLSNAQGTWVDRTSTAGMSAHLQDVAWGNGTFVAVGTNMAAGLIYTSADGLIWTNRTQPANIGGNLTAVEYGNGRFVAVGTNLIIGLIATSADGVNWTNQTSNASIGGIFQDVAYGNGVWVAVGTNMSQPVVATSLDGIAWANRTGSTGLSGGILHAVTFAEGRFVAVGTNGVRVMFAASTDGVTWQDHTNANAIGGVAYDVVHDGTRYIATGDGTPSGGSTSSHVLVSADGSSWTSHTVAAGLGGIGYGLRSGGGTTVMVGRTGSRGLIATTTDGTSWTNLTSQVDAPGDLLGVARGATGWVAVGTNYSAGVVMTSEAVIGGSAVFFDEVLEVGANGGNYRVEVSANAGTNWTVTGDADWISLGASPSGSGNGNVTVTVDSNPSAQPRSGTLTVGDDTLAVNQGGQPLSAPILSAGRTEADTVFLIWTVVAGSNGYQIERRSSPDAAFTFLAQTVGGGNVSATDSSVSNGQSFDYRVRAYSGQIFSDWSNIETVGIPPAIPDDLAASARNSSQIELTWSDVTGESGYLIQRESEDGSYFENLAILSANETRYIDSGLEPVTPYRYRIEATSDVYGRYSDPASASTLAETRAIVWGDSRNMAAESFFGIAYGNGITVAVGEGGRLTTSTDLTNWTERTRPATDTLRAVAFAQNRFVAVGDGGRILSGSADGSQWQSVDSPVEENFVGIAFQGGLWVAVGAAGALITSTDGSSWTVGQSPVQSGFEGVFAGGGKFVVIEESGRLFTSDDGSAWRETRGRVPVVSSRAATSLETDGTVYRLRWNSVIGTTYQVLGRPSLSSGSWEPEGFTMNGTGGPGEFEATPPAGAGSWFWVVSTQTPTVQPFFWTRTAGAFGGSAYSVVGPAGYHSAGADAESWGEHNFNRMDYLEAVAYGNGTFVAVGLNGRTARSSTGQAYLAGGDAPGALNGIVYAGNRFVAAGERGLIVSSVNGSSWTTVRPADGFEADFSAVVSGGGRVLVFGEDENGSIAVRNSFDGSGWASSNLSVAGIDFPPRIRDAVFDGSNFVAVGDEGVILTSSNGVAWTTQRVRAPGGFNDFLSGVAAGQNILLAGGGNDPLLRSTDGGQIWTPVSGLPLQFSASILSFGQRWVSCGQGQWSVRVFYSANGEDWSSGSVRGSAVNIQKIAAGSLDGQSLHAGAGAAFGGNSPQAMVSWDGRNWNALEAPGINDRIEGIAYGNGVFVAVGRGGSRVWASLDGARWEGISPGKLPGFAGFKDVVFHQGFFYAVGNYGTIFRLSIASSDFAPTP